MSNTPHGYISIRAIMRRKQITKGAVERAIRRYGLQTFAFGKSMYITSEDARIIWGIHS